MNTLTPTPVTTWNWPTIAKSLDDQGFAVTPPVLSPADRAELIAMYDEPEPWQDRVQQDTYRLGPGEHRRFTTPPPTIAELQSSCLPHLASITDHWPQAATGSPGPTLITHHRAHEYQSLHQQDEQVFPCNSPSC